MNINGINTLNNSKKINNISNNETEEVSFGLRFAPRMEHLGNLLELKKVPFLDQANIELIVPRAVKKLEEDNIINDLFKEALQNAEMAKVTSLSDIMPDYATTRVPLTFFDSPEGLRAGVGDSKIGNVSHIIIEGKDWAKKIASGDKSFDEGLTELARKFAHNTIATSRINN